HGYKGVNNHTGSRFTADKASMRVVLEELDRRGYFFLDSLTTGRPVAAKLAKQDDWRVIERDIFLDADYPNVSAASVKAQLSALERVAKRDGHAIAIGHPYDATLETLGPWLLTAPARGFDLVVISALAPERPAPGPLVLASLR
ncbi:MAG: divergent polysaccharide deacetylase family protein, partial [Pseudomonadota bacterium]